MNKQLLILGLLLFTYRPAFLQTPNEEVGLASYYSDNFQGKPTASGELYDNQKFTAAHKTLPFGTILTVTHLGNNKSVEVRVNDRGPFISGRIIEVSGAAAEQIGLKIEGVARVRIAVKGKASSTATTDVNPADTGTPKTTGTKTTEKGAGKSAPTTIKTTSSDTKAKAKESKPTAKTAETDNEAFISSGSYQITPISSGSGFGVQVASFENESGMFAKVDELKSKWFNNIFVTVTEGAKGKKSYKVILGTFDTREKAEEYKVNLKKNKKIDGFVVPLSNTGN